ncbi:MAG: hypothetical protein M1812_006425 [Candelaria pacifica]|nr:MAG: hypothetical protein M1812_006425 [Candelaria pacifica]
MQFINRSLLVAAAALALAQSTVADEFQYPTGNYSGPGVYTITNNATGTNLDLLDGGAAAGTAINGWTAQAANNPHQQWRIAQVNPDLVTISNVGTGTFVAADPNVNPTTTGPLNKVTGQLSGTPLNAQWVVNIPTVGYNRQVNPLQSSKPRELNCF